MVRPRHAVAVAVCSLLVAGCYRSHPRGGDAADASAPPSTLPAPELADAGPLPPPDTPERFAFELAEAYCQVAAECSSPVSSTRVPDLTSRVSVELCVHHGGYGRLARQVAAPFVDAVRRGEASFHPEMRDACLDAVRRATCFVRSIRRSSAFYALGRTPPFGDGAPGTPAYDPACRALFRSRGSLGEGAACAGPLDCAEGLRCGPTPDAPGACVLRCLPVAAEGTACEAGFLGSTCRLTQLACIDNRCVAAPFVREAEPGAPCGLLERADGRVRERCRPGAYCAADDDGPICRVDTAQVGDACGGDLRCAAPLVCEAGPWRCRALALAEAERDACTNGYTGDRLCDPRAGLSCAPDTFGFDRCVRLPPGTEGAPCETFEACGPGLTCRGGVCTARLDAGAPCNTDRFCLSGYCDRTLEQCVDCPVRR